MENKSASRYGAMQIGLHWLMLLLIAAVYACIELHDFYPKGSDTREALKQWHFMLGMSVFLLAWLRVALRVITPVQPIVSASKPWEDVLAKVVHLALYVLMLGVPLLGWLTLSAGGKPIPFFGLQLPALVGENRELAKVFKEIHEVLGIAGYFLIGFHAAAALFHHYVKRDNTMLRMLPRR